MKAKKVQRSNRVASDELLGVTHTDAEMRACLMQARKIAGNRNAVAPCHVAVALDCDWLYAATYLANAEQRGFCLLRVNGIYTLMAKMATPNVELTGTPQGRSPARDGR